MSLETTLDFAPLATKLYRGLMRRIARRGRLMLVVVLLVPGRGFSQGDQQSGALIVSGHPGQAPVIQINGRPYVAVDALARLMNGSLGYQGSQITLTLSAATSAERTPPPAGQSAKPALSRDFLKAGIETMSDIREWRSALLVAVENGYKVTDLWLDNYRAPAAKNLRLASIAATTDSDRNALQLLSKELDHMQELSNKILTARRNLSYISPDTLRKDPLDQKILKCARSLAAMAASGEFQDDGSCH
jgi:hypothetical protein